MDSFCGVLVKAVTQSHERCDRYPGLLLPQEHYKPQRANTHQRLSAKLVSGVTNIIAGTGAQAGSASSPVPIHTHSELSANASPEAIANRHRLAAFCVADSRKLHRLCSE